MTLDPEIAAMLEAARAAPGGGVGDLPLDEARIAYRDRYRARGIVPDRAVAAEDLAVPGPGGPLPARLYRAPQDAGGRLALYFHGGGYMLGDIEAYDAQSRMLAALSGVDLLFVDYRRAPEHPFPAAAEDAVAAARWTLAEAPRLGADPARVAAAGDSAGGALAVVAALSGAPLAGLLLLYPWVDMRPYAGGPPYPSTTAFAEGFFLDHALMELFVRRLLPRPGDALDPRASPLLADGLGRLPPVRIVTASHDPLRDMGEALADRIRAEGGAAEARRMPGLVHNFMGHAGVSAGARRAFHEVAGMLGALLR